MTDSPPDSDPTTKPRGLWSVIAHSSVPMPAEEESEVEAETAPLVKTQPEEPASSTPRSLFAIMRRAETADPVTPQSSEASHSKWVEIPSGPAEPSEEIVQTQHETLDATQPAAEVECYDHLLPLADVGDELRKSLRKSSLKRIRQSSITLLCGIASIGLSVLSIRPEVWMSIPASGFGFFSIILGYMTLTGTRLRDLSSFTKIASQSGMLLGTLGIFLGPLVFAGLGRELRESSGNQHTRKHLVAVGEALKKYHDQHAAYPVGGTFIRENSGAFKGQHGWMTFLLPFIGEQSLFSQIDQSKPFDAPENRKAMGHEIEVYYAAGGDRTKIGQGYAVTHFAGVGGDIDDESGIVHAGIFTRDTAIKQSDVTDGLANTMIVGEVAGNFAPWGDPENLRTTGKGLNKDVNGFGNSTGNGAMFLFGDGSVKMLSNKTDPRLLKKLSTRDGGEQ